MVNWRRRVPALLVGMPDRAVKTVSDLLERVRNLRKLWRPDAQPKSRGEELALWFRGQRSANWGLSPRIYRPEFARAEEAEIFLEFQSKALQLLQARIPQSAYEWYFLMQHCRSPTRLLGWTDNPLLALFFAVDEDRPRGDAAVWLLDPSWWNDKLEMPFSGPILPEWKEARFWLYELEDAFSTNVQAAQPYPVAIDPPHVDRRLTVQGSHFLIFGTRKNFARTKPVRGPKSRLAKIVVHRDAVLRIHQELERCGINRFSVFPDMDNLGIEISRKWRKF